MTSHEDIDQALRTLPVEPVPPSVLASVRDIPFRPRPAPWRADIARAAAGVVPGLLLWGIRPLLPEALESFVPAALAFAGTAIFTSAILRFRLLGSSG